LSSFILLISCQQEPTFELPSPPNPNTPFRIDSSFVPPVKELKYVNSGSFYFGFTNSGYYNFSADTAGRQFKVLLKQYQYWGPTPDSNLYTYRFDTLYHLTEIERTDFQGNPATSIKLFYTNQRLSRFEEWAGTTKYKTYTITNEFFTGGRRIIIAPYVNVDPSITDTISHTIEFDMQDKVAAVKERLRRTGGLNELWNYDFLYQYSNNDIDQVKGYQLFENFSPVRKDSLWTTYSYIRSTGESPVLAAYLKKLYGIDFYTILNHCKLLSLQSTPNGVLDLLKLPGQAMSSQTQYQYAVAVYTNGVFSHLQASSWITENNFDIQNRLIKSKVNSTPPNYYTWEIIYR
jgi:hypothetical protein